MRFDQVSGKKVVRNFDVMGTDTGTAKKGGYMKSTLECSQELEIKSVCANGMTIEMG